MSGSNIQTITKSCSESEMTVENDNMNINNSKQSDGSKLKRTFTLPRNPFGSVRMSKRRPKTTEGQQDNVSSENSEQISPTDNDKPGKKVFRRPSWRKFINKIAQHMNSVGVPGVKQNVSDRVPPLGGYVWPPDHTPGVTGLRNHGNTCFMNAVLQCLSHTDILAEYFVLDQYKVDLSRRNKLNSRKLGTRGELTEQLALVLKALWACRDSPELSTGFKAVVERHSTQFRGSAQHDAQEFLIWLLDKVHEDLNTATKRRYKVIKNTLGRPDEVVAAETLANYVRCNSSFVQAVFQAQFRSSLTCPRCHKQSNTFDPFHCISVQLPQVSVQNVIVTVLYSSQQPRQVRLGLSVSPGSAITALREVLQTDTGITSSRIILTEIGVQGFTRTFCDSQPMSVLCDGDPIYCIEAPPLDTVTTEIESHADDDLVPMIDGGPYLLLCWVNVLVKENGDVEKFGSPYAMQVPRDTGYCDLQKLLLKEMAPMLHDNVLEGVQPSGIFKTRLAEPLADLDNSQYLNIEVEHPLFTETIDTCFSLYPPDAGPPHIKLILEWNTKEYCDYIQHPQDVTEDHSSVAELQASSANNTPLTLEQCLEHYTRAETLSEEDAWRCPHCQKYMSVVKTLGLWSLPDILVICFKRFRQQQLKGTQTSKLTNLVDFPLVGFDMSPHLSRPGPPVDDLQNKNSAAPLLGGVGWSPWKRPRKISHSNENLYDLYAVCYHRGDDLETGHYTAACKNPFDAQWYQFDDTKVTKIESDVRSTLVNNGAYILFYQRRQGGSEESSAASSSSGDHWSSRMIPFPKSIPIDNKTVEENNKKISTNIIQKSESFVNDIEKPMDNATNIRNSMSLSDNLMVNTCTEKVDNIDPTEKSNVDLNDNDKITDSKNICNNDVLDSTITKKIDPNEYRRNTFDGTINKDIHINPKMGRSSTNMEGHTSSSSIKSDSKINSVTKVNVEELLSKNIENKLSLNTVNKNNENKKALYLKADTSALSNDLIKSGSPRPSLDIRFPSTCSGYATLGPTESRRETTDYRDHHSDDEALPARDDWMSPLSMRRTMVVPNH